MTRAQPRLYLVTPPLGDAGRDRGRSRRRARTPPTSRRCCCGSSDGDEAALLERIKTLRILIQSNGAALLLDGHAELVGARGSRRRASHRHRGAHGGGAAPASPKSHRRLRRAGPATTPCWPANSGADYVMFGEPTRRPPAVLRRGARARRLVGGNVDRSRASAMRRTSTRSKRWRGAGADFVAVDEAVWRSARAVATAAERLARSPCDEALRLLILLRRSAPSRGDSAGAQPMQITPPVARPPASIPASRRRSPKAAVKQRQGRRHEAPAPEEVDRRAGRTAAAVGADRVCAGKPAGRAVHGAGKARADARPQTTALQPQARRRARRRCLRRLSARPLSRGLQGGDAPRQRTGRPGRDDAARRSLRQRLRRGEGREARRSPGSRSRPTAATARRSSRSRWSRFAGRGGAAGQGRSRGAARQGRQARPRRGRLQSRAALSRGPAGRARTSRAPPSCCASAADAGSPEAQYALATLYKEGNGVPKDPAAAAKLLGAAARAGNDRGARSNTPSRCSTAPASPRTRAAAAALFRKAAHKGNAVAQNRLARILATGAGCRPIRSEATKWHTIAKAGGASDIWLDKLHAADQGQRAHGARERRAALAGARQAQCRSRSSRIALRRRAKPCFAHGALIPGLARQERAILVRPADSPCMPHPPFSTS